MDCNDTPMQPSTSGNQMSQNCDGELETVFGGNISFGSNFSDSVNQMSFRPQSNSVLSQRNNLSGGSISRPVTIPYRLPLIEKPKQRTCVLSGTIEQIVNWHRSLTPSSTRFYEIIGVYVCEWDDGSRHHRIFLLRQPRGPVIKILTFQGQQPPIPHCTPGSYLRVMGTMKEGNILRAHIVNRSTELDYSRMDRVSHINDRAVRHF